MDFAYAQYGQFAAWALREIICKAPWRDAYGRGDGAEIDTDRLRRCFLGDCGDHA